MAQPEAVAAFFWATSLSSLPSTCTRAANLLSRHREVARMSVSLTHGRRAFDEQDGADDRSYRFMHSSCGLDDDCREGRAWKLSPCPTHPLAVWRCDNQAPSFAKDVRPPPPWRRGSLAERTVHLLQLATSPAVASRSVRIHTLARRERKQRASLHRAAQGGVARAFDSRRLHQFSPRTFRLVAAGFAGVAVPIQELDPPPRGIWAQVRVAQLRARGRLQPCTYAEAAKSRLRMIALFGSTIPSRRRRSRNTLGIAPAVTRANANVLRFWRMQSTPL